MINPYYITGLDEELLKDLKKDHDIVVTLEDGILEWWIWREDRTVSMAIVI